MSALMRWNPFRTSTWDPFKELEEFESRLGTMFGRMPVRTDGEKEPIFGAADWAPLVDITEDEKEFLIKAEIPGMKKEELKVSVENGVMTISGERRMEKEEKGKKYHRVERAHGRFERSFTLPDKADSTKVQAQYKDGILELRLPKTEKVAAQTTQIAIT